MPSILLEVEVDGSAGRLDAELTEGDTIETGVAYTNSAGIQVTVRPRMERRGVDIPTLASYLIEYGDNAVSAAAAVRWLLAKTGVHHRIRRAWLNRQPVDLKNETDVLKVLQAARGEEK